LLDSINNVSPLVANKILESMTANEIRQIVGLPPETGGSDLPAASTAPAALSKQLDNEVAQSLIDLGEDALEEWLLIDESEVDYENDDLENEILTKEVKQSLLSKVYNFVSTGDARPNITSEQDKIIDGMKFVTRYVYAGQTSENSREFCKKMISANKIYRKEDILNMSSEAVNKGWGAEGADTYSIWLYKGGGACHHRWNKQVYATFSGKALDIPNAKVIAQAKAAKQGYIIKNEALVSTRPIDMPNEGFLPTNKRFN